MKTRNGLPRVAVGLVAMLTFWAAPAASAATLIWDTDTFSPGAQDGGGTWQTGQPNWRNFTTSTDNQNWSAGTVDKAQFGAVADGTYSVTISGAVVAGGGLNFAYSGYTLSGGTSLSLDTGSANGPISVDAGKSATINTLLTGRNAAATITLNDGSVLNLGGGFNTAQYRFGGAGTLNITGGTSAPAVPQFNCAVINQTGGTNNLGNKFTAAIGYNSGRNVSYTISGSSVMTVNNAESGAGLIVGRALASTYTATLIVKESAQVNIGTTAAQYGSLHLVNGSTGDGASSALLDVQGGRVTIGTGNAANKLRFFSQGAANGRTATLQVSGGIVTANGIQFGNTNALTYDATALAKIQLSVGSLSVGAAGIIRDSTASTLPYLIQLQGGTLSATADWSSSLDMKLGTTGGGVTIKAADASDLPKNITLSGSLSNDGAVDGTLTKTGTGTLTLSGANTYTGDTLINAGTLRFVVGGSCASPTVILNAATATHSVRITESDKVWTNNAFTASAAGTLEFDLTAVTPSTTVSPFVVSGAATFTATPSVNVLLTSGLEKGAYPLMTWGSSSGTIPTAVTVSAFQDGTAPSLSNSVDTLTLYLVIGDALPAVKANNTDNLNVGTSWTNGVVPSSASVAIWDSTVTAANTNLLGADTTWAGIQILDPGGLVTVDAGNTLTLGLAPTDIDLSAATADLTLNCGLALNGTNVWDVTTGRTLTVGGAVSGVHPITKQGAGTAILSSSENAYTGDTTISQGTLQLGANEVIPHGIGTGNLTVNGTLDLNTYSETINSLSGVGIVDTLAGGTPTLTITNTLANTFSGAISNSAGALSLVKSGSGLLTLAGESGYSGGTTINAGYVTVTSSNALGTGAVTFNGGSRLTVATGLDVTNAITIGVNVGVVGYGLIEAGTNAGVAIVSGPITINNGATAGGHFCTRQTPGSILHVKGVITSTLTNGAVSHRAGTVMFSGGGIGYTNLTLGEGIMMVGATNGIATTATVLIAASKPGTLDLNGFDQSLAGITKHPTYAATITNSSATTSARLTLTGTSSYAGVIRDGGGDGKINLAVDGGSLTLSGTNTYSGATTISSGTLKLGANNALPNVTAISIGTGTLDADTRTDTVGTLAVTGAATINLGTGGKLVFDNSSGTAWTGTLNITGAFVSGISLRFGTTSSGLTRDQLARIPPPAGFYYELDVNGFLKLYHATLLLFR
jgi:autotransporter-associated beta strand protein